MGAKELGGRTEGVTILAELALILINGDVLLITNGELAIMEQPPNGARCFDLRTFRKGTAMINRLTG